MDAAARQLPDEPGVDGAEREPVRAAVTKQPFELRRREVGIGNEPGARPDEVLRQLATPLRRTTVLPDDRALHGLARSPVPQQRRLALVRDPDRLHVAGANTCVDERLLRRRDDALPDVLGIVLHPTGPRVVLAHRAKAAPARPELAVDDEARRATGALVDRKNHPAS